MLCACELAGQREGQEWLYARQAIVDVTVPAVEGECWGEPGAWRAPCGRRQSSMLRVLHTGTQLSLWVIYVRLYTLVCACLFFFLPPG